MKVKHESRPTPQAYSRLKTGLVSSQAPKLNTPKRENPPCKAGLNRNYRFHQPVPCAGTLIISATPQLLAIPPATMPHQILEIRLHNPGSRIPFSSTVHTNGDEFATIVGMDLRN